MEKSSSNNDDDLQHNQNLEKDDGACNDFGMFEVEEGNGFGDDDDDDDDGDGFGLLTQALTQNNVNVKNAADSSSDESSDESSSGSSSSDESSDSDSSTEGNINTDGTPIQERRARNMRRNKAFVDNLKLELNAMMNNGQADDKDNKQKSQSSKRKKIKEVEEVEDMSITSENNVTEINKRKRRGMIFSTTVSNKQSSTIQPPTQPLLTTKSLTDELNPKYPHRSNQIQVLCSQLVSIVQQSKFAWQMKNNLRSMGSSQYSEASYQGDIKMATPSPIMITGAGGNGKTCIVLDAMKALQRRTNGNSINVHPTVANAYIDCASSESGSVGAVMNSAYRQLYESYHFNNGFGRYDKVEVNGKAFKSKEKWKYTSSSSGIARSNLDGGNDFQDDIESDGAADDESMGEDQLERQRSRAQKLETNRRNGKKVKTVRKSKKKATINQNSVRQTRLRASLDSAKLDKQQHQSVGLGGSIPSNVAASKSAQNSGSVALFGRATSALIQAGNTTKRRSSDNWRCAFLILDNADRILSWNTKNGSINPLTQIFLLPSVMGINLTFIFISRSTIFPYSAVHNPPGTLLDAIHPQSIHFHSYSSVESIKSILHVPHIQQSIIGKATSSTSHKFRCNIANKLRSKLNDWLYASMMNSFIPSVISSTHDITEIMRLARLLWPEYTAPLDKNSNYDDPALVSLMWQVVGGLYREDESLDDPCSDCSFCQKLSTGVDDALVENLNTQKQRLSEKLDRNIRESMRKLLSNTVMMPGRVLMKQTQHPYAGRLPYITKFLLLAAFLCQNKRSEQDANLYTRQNTGKSKRRRANKPGDETAYAAASKDMTQRQPSFPLERMLSVFYSIIDQFGQNHYMTYKEEGASVAAQLGTERLFRNISQLIATGLLSTTGSAKFNERYNQNLMDKTDAKFSCNISRGDARVIATSVGFPLEKYCP